jgi:uncharacterized OsmC-like protein
MTVKMTGKYLGDKKVELLHEQSGTSFSTAAPLDNNGDGSSFSPTDLLAVSFPTCVMTIMSIAAEQKEFSLVGASFSVEKHMIATPRRLGKLIVRFCLPASLSERERTICESAVQSCPVHGSLHPDIELDVAFDYSV